MEGKHYVPDEGLISIVYITARRDPKFEWFANSFYAQKEALKPDVRFQVILVDRLKKGYGNKSKGRVHTMRHKGPFQKLHVSPKPSPWQGPHKLAKADFFAPSNARNTGVCHAKGSYVVFVDDISVLVPGWLESVLEARSKGHIMAGAFQKVKDLEVNKQGDIVKATSFPEGKDAREKTLDQTKPSRMNGGSLFGCSLGTPMQALFDTNGFDEDCDSMGAEDYTFGLMAERNGYEVWYYPKARTFESEELHHIPDDKCIRIIKKTPDEKDIDYSHVHLNMVLHGGRNRAPNYFPAGDLKNQRDYILDGNTFPVAVSPCHDWRDGEPICMMGGEDG